MVKIQNPFYSNMLQRLIQESGAAKTSVKSDRNPYPFVARNEKY